MNMIRPLHTLRYSALAVLAATFVLSACSDDTNDPGSAFDGPSGFRMINVSTPTDLTPDGSTAVLEERFGTALGNIGDIFFYDLATGKLTKQMNVGGFQSFATGVSQDLQVSANYGEPVVAGVWSHSGGWQTANPPGYFESGCDMLIGGAWDISADGQKVAGFDWNNCSVAAMVWNKTGGSMVAEPLEVMGASYPDSPNPPSNRATTISDNGALIGGSAQTELTDRYPVIWDATSHLGTIVPGGPGIDWPGEVLSINADGTVVGGTWGMQGFYWHVGDASATMLGQISETPAEFTITAINAIVAGNNLMFGTSNGKAVVWTSATGFRYLTDVAKANGVNIPENFTANVVIAASTDGTVVLGQGYNLSQAVSFVLKMPVSAYGL